MKPKSTLRSYLALAGSTLLAISYTHAATFYWDGTDTDANANGGLGNWDNLLTNWDTLAAAGVSSAWSTGSIAVFSGAGAVVTLTDNITVGGLTFNKVNGGTTYYTINAATNNKTLSFASGDNYIRLNIGNGGAPTATITGQVAGSGANLIVGAQNTVASGNSTAVGTVIFNGASTGGWTGATTIGLGTTLSTVSTVALTNKVLNDTSGITLNGGTLQFTRDGNAALGAISDTADIGVNGGGTFSVTSTAGGASAIENIDTVTVNSGQMNFVQTANNANQLVLGGLSRGLSTTSAVTFSSAAFGTARFKVSSAGTTSGWTDAANSNSIIGAWATTGSAAATQTDYAVYNGDFIAAANTTATAETNWTDATKQYTLSYATKTATALTATRNIAALKASTPIASVSSATSNGSPTFTVASGHSFAVNDPVVIGTAPGGFVPGRVYYVESVGGGGTTFTLSATPGGAAINATSNVTATFAGGIKLDSGITLGTTGILNAGTALAIGRTLAGSGSISLPTAGAGNLFINAGSGNIGIDVPIVNNGGALTLVKTGNSILHLTNNNTFTGGLVVNAGTVRLTGDQTITGGITLNGGAFGDGTDGISAAEIDSNSVTVNGNASMYITGAETLASAIAINSKGNLRLAAGSGNGTISGVVSGSGVLTVSHNVAANTVILSNTANTHTGIVSIVSDNNANFTLAVNSLVDSATPGAGNIQMGGGGTLGGHTFALHTGAIAPLILNNRQVELIGDGTSGVLFKLSNNSTTQAFTINSDLLASGTNVKTLTLGGAANAGLSTFAGAITNGSHTTLNITKENASNTWALTNTANSYNGITTITAGTLQVSSLANGGSNSSIGSSSNAAGNLILNGGTLQYTGAGSTTDRLFSLQSSSTIDSSGVGAVDFNNTGAMSFNSGVAAKVLTLTGTNTGANTIAASISNNTGTTGITKSGTGTWVLTNANTYTGATNVNGGILQLKSGVSTLTQTLGALALAGADVTLESNKSGAGDITTNFTSLTARAAGNTGNMVSTGGSNGTTNTVNITGAAGFIDKGIYFNGADFAYRDATNTYARAPIYDTDATFLTTATASNHIKLSASYSGAGMTLLSLNLAGSAVGWTNASGSLTAPGIIKSGGGSPSTISGGNLTAGTNTELVIRTDTSSDSLAISSNLTQGNGALTKSGAGTLTLSGSSNTYSGATNVNGGTLALGASNVLSGGAVTIHSATLDAATFTDTVGTLDPAAAATINFGSGGALAFSNSSAVSWTGGTLNLTGTLNFAGGSGSSLRFGTTNAGLTAVQLSQITASGYSNFGLDADGYLTAVSGGSAPEIAVDQSGNINTGGSKAFGTVTIGSPTSLIFTINNTGNAALNLSGSPRVAVTGDADFTVTAQPAASVSGPGSTTFTVQFAPSASGVRSAVLSIANNDTTGGENPFVINVSGTGQTPYEAWALGGAFNADANGDGVKNGLAFLLGATSPTSAVIQPTVTQSGGDLILNFNMLKPANRGTTTLNVQHSRDLGIADPWATVLVPDATNAVPTLGVTFVVGVGGGTTNPVTATISSSEAGGTGKLFGRLQGNNP